MVVLQCLSFLLMFIVHIVNTENGSKATHYVHHAASSSKDKAKDETIKITVPQKFTVSDDLLQKSESQGLEVQSTFNYTDDGGNTDNETKSNSGQQKISFTVGKWTVVQCGSNENSWVCEMERHLIIPEIGFCDTLKFVIGGEKLKISASEQPLSTKSSPSPSPLATPVPPVPPTQRPIHLRIMVQCPACDEHKCSASEMYLHSFWLGMIIGVIIGMVVVALFTTCISAAISKPKVEKIKEEIL